MEELDQIFNEYIETFKSLDIMEKREELINCIKELIAAIDVLAKSENIGLHYLNSREILDLKQENVSEDDFLEAMMVYIEVGKNLIGEYFEKKGI